MPTMHYMGSLEFVFYDENTLQFTDINLYLTRNIC